MSADRNFDDISHKFSKNIYGSGKGAIRQAILLQDLQTIVTQLNSHAPLQILDAGGGQAPLSQALAANGHNITLCDISQNMLQNAREQISAANLLDRFQFIHSPVQNLPALNLPPCDLLLFHAVLEWLSEPKQGLQEVLSQVRRGGIASVMFYNQNGLLFKNLVCGNLTHIEQGMPHCERFKLQPPQSFLPEHVYQWISECGFEILGKSGVRTFHDYMQTTRLGEHTFEQVIAMEQQLCRQEPFVSLGRYIHVWARRREA
ncbi:MAG: tRNA uridine 5-oxyacetic acid(34) methyltransferase CmoM [Vibrionaceae bacterium]